MTAAGAQPTVFANAQPLSNDSLEPAVSRITVILATNGPFTVGGRQMAAFLAGPRTTPLPITYPKDASCLEWSLSVFETRAALGISPKEIAENVVDLSSLTKTEAVRRLLDGQPLDSSLLSCAHEPPPDMQLVKASWAALSAGNTLATVCLELGVSLRRLEQAFQSSIGLTPKQLQSLLRFERAYQLLGTNETLSSIAHRLGFSDQSHMTRQVSRYSGLTPSALRRALTITA